MTLTKEEKSYLEDEWIAIGDKLFVIDDLLDITIQKNHLIISFDKRVSHPLGGQVNDQVVVYFQSYEECKKVFNVLCHLKNAKKIALPQNALINPDIMETFYGDELNKRVTDRVSWEEKRIKERYKKKLEKALRVIEELKKIKG